MCWSSARPSTTSRPARPTASCASATSPDGAALRSRRTAHGQNAPRPPSRISRRPPAVWQRAEEPAQLIQVRHRTNDFIKQEGITVSIATTSEPDLDAEAQRVTAVHRLATSKAFYPELRRAEAQ